MKWIIVPRCVFEEGGKHNGQRRYICKALWEDREKYNDDSRSISNQIDLMTDYCQKHGYNIYDVYIDDGISGMERNRPAFKRLLKDCEDGRLDIPESVRLIARNERKTARIQAF